MRFLRGQLLKVLEWEDNTADTMAYKVPLPPKTEIMMGSQLIVRESQVCVLTTGGKIADVFVPGRYKLDTGNMPVLTKLKSWKYGFASPFVCDVYFINTKQFINQKWGTSSPIMMRDQDFGLVQFRGFGKFSFKVNDPVIFLRELLGSAELYKVGAVVEQLKSNIVSGISETVARSNIPALDLAIKYSAIGKAAEALIDERFHALGIDMTDLVVENLSLIEENMKMMSKRTDMNIIGNLNDYTQFNAAEAMKTVAENAHKGQGGMNMAGTAMSMGAGWAVGNMFGNSLNNKGANPAGGAAPMPAPTTTGAMIVCPECTATIPAGVKFCPECGKNQGPATKTCSKCNAVNKERAKFCADCGNKL